VKRRKPLPSGARIATLAPRHVRASNDELSQEHRGGNFTKALVRRALGRDGSTTRRIGDQIQFEATMRRIAETGR
jgi:hypothetical protein